MNSVQARRKNSSGVLQQVITTVQRHLLGVLVATFLLAVVGLIAVSLMPDIYKATTTILVDPQKIPEKYVSSTVTTDPNGRLNTLTQQILSASLLQGIIEANNLYPVLRTKKSREEVLDYMREQIKIELKQSPEPEQGLSSFTISFEDKDPALVALITNQLASSFIDSNLKVRQQEAVGTTQFLSSELNKAKASLEEQERALQTFKLQHAGATPDELDGNMQALSRLQSEEQSNMDAVSRLDQERILIKHSPSLDSQSVPLTERDRALQEKRRLEAERWALKRQFTDAYPDVVANAIALRNVNDKLASMPEPAQGSSDHLDPVLDTRLTLIDKEMERHKQQLADIRGQIRSYQGKVDSVPVLQTQLLELTRNYEASRQNYQSLLDKTFSAGMSEELERKHQAERFTVLDPARRPEKPARPKRLPLMAGALLFALVLPTALVGGIQILRGTVLTEHDLQDILPANLPILCTMPTIHSKQELLRLKLQVVGAVLVSVLAGGVLAAVLYKVRPIL